VRVAPELQKNVLQHLFRVAGLLQDSQNERVHRPAIPVVEGFQRVRILLGEPLASARYRSADRAKLNDRKKHGA